MIFFCKEKKSGLDGTVMVLESFRHWHFCVWHEGNNRWRQSVCYACIGNQTQEDFTLNALTCVVLSKKLLDFGFATYFLTPKHEKLMLFTSFLYCCNFLSFFFSMMVFSLSLLSEIDLKIICYINPILYIQRWGPGNHNSYFLSPECSLG